MTIAVLDQVKDGWEFVIDPDVRGVSLKYSFYNLFNVVQQCGSCLATSGSIFPWKRH